MKNIEKIIQFIESQDGNFAGFERKAGISNGYLKNTAQRGAEITDKILDKIRKSLPEDFEKIFPDQVVNISANIRGSSSVVAKPEAINTEKTDISTLIEANLLHANNCARLISILEQGLLPKRIVPAKKGAAGHKTYARKNKGTG